MSVAEIYSLAQEIADRGPQGPGSDSQLLIDILIKGKSIPPALSAALARQLSTAGQQDEGGLLKRAAGDLADIANGKNVVTPGSTLPHIAYVMYGNDDKWGAWYNLADRSA